VANVEKESRRVCGVKSALFDEFYADRAGNFNYLSGRTEPASLRIDTEDYNGPGVLVGGQQIAARWVNAKVARGFSLGGLVANQTECSFRWIDRKYGNAVMAAVRAVEELS
jgi:hypothetical protein